MEKKDQKFKDFLSKHRKALISLVLCVAVAAVFIPTLYRSQVDELAREAAGLNNTEEVQTTEEENAAEDAQTGDDAEENSEESGSAESAVSGHPTGSGSQGQTSTSNSDSGSGDTDLSTPSEPEQYTCYLEVECHTILNNMDDLTEGKEHLVPSNGVIYSNYVNFTQGQSAYDVLRAAMQVAGIQMDAEYNSLYDSAYIKGINNLYEFDCGSYSGWMYSVNGTYPNYGASVSPLSDGDRVIFSYTCDLGRDL